MKKIQLTKRIISLLSAGTIALTMGSCDSEETSKVEETTIVIETDAEETESIIAQLVTNKVSVTTVPDITSAVSSDSEPIEDTIDSSVDITIDSITETPIEDPIESTTEVTTNRPIETVETTTKPKPDVTTKPDTTKPSVVTTKPIESTTSKPIEDPIETQKVEKLTTKNINNIAAIDAIAEQAYRYVYSVNNYALFTYISYYYEGQEYVCGRDEFRLFIALLNEQHISEDIKRIIWRYVFR